MDYSKMSDFEVNKLVSAAIGAKVTESVGFVNTGEDIRGHYQEPVLLREVTNNRRHWKRFDPCNNPTDAWPIIVDNRISLLSVESLNGDFAWLAKNKACPSRGDKNPLRAAMIVFLMMKESANVQDNPA